MSININISMAIEKGDLVLFNADGHERVGTIKAVKYLIQWEEKFMWVESGEVRKND
jgi:hypothetical protein